MKKFFLALMFLYMFSCQRANKTKFISKSNGNINNITVVMEKTYWNGAIGRSIRSEFQKPYEGLPIDEPVFTLNYLNPKAFSGFARNSRNIILIKKSDSIDKNVNYIDKFAQPQIISFFVGKEESIVSNIKDKSEHIRQLFKENERKEKLKRMGKAFSKEKTLQERFKIKIKYPNVYKTVKDTSNFIWIEKAIGKGTLNIISYTIPLQRLKKNYYERIIEIRDSIGKLYIPGRFPGSHMITEKAYTPFFYKTKILNRETILTKGTWEVKKDFMAGPFINYCLKDSINQRWLLVEGFAFAPSVRKRDYMFELNTIIKTLKIEDN
ncbi:MAG: DUF4837 family protein [Flavobacteriaceae bacterium]|nr:DUF4837 family protein [Flavobacteriaceae bacterium]